MTRTPREPRLREPGSVQGARHGAMKSLLSSTALHGAVLGLGCVFGVSSAIRAAEEPSAPRETVAIFRAPETQVLQEEPREDLEPLEPEVEVLPEPELLPVEPEYEPPVYEEDEILPLNPDSPDLVVFRDRSDFAPKPVEPELPQEPVVQPALEPMPKPAQPAPIVVLPPEPLSVPNPDYPRLSMRRGEEGSVLCHIHIDAAGSVTKVEVQESSGFDRLDDAARAALAKWRFRPSTIDGVPSPSVYRHRVHFQIGG